MIRKTVVILTLALAGCVSTQNALETTPTEVIMSSKNQTEVAFCLANANNVPSLDAPDGSKVIQIKNGFGATGIIFSVYTADNNGSRIEIRKPISVGIYQHRKCY